MLVRRVVTRFPQCAHARMLHHRWQHVVAAEPNVDFLDVRLDTHPDKRLRFHYMWLRCVAPRSPQRGRHRMSMWQNDFNLSAESRVIHPAFPHIHPRTVWVETDGTLHVEWPESPVDPSGHHSAFSPSFLAENCYWWCDRENTTNTIPNPHGNDPVTGRSDAHAWTVASLPDALPSVPMEDAMGSNEGVLRWLDLICTWGFAIVKGVPATMEGTQAVVERIGPLQSTIYGSGMWRTEIRPGGNDTAYQSIALQPHTDGNYMGDVPRLQIFHCLQPDTSGGGETILVDGLSIADKLARESPDTLDFFCDTPLPFFHTDAEFDLLEYRTPFRRRHPLGPIEAFGFNNDDRAPLTADAFCEIQSRSGSSIDPSEWVPRFYSHLQRLLRASRDAELALTFPMVPGDLVAIDNRRVLHGRTAFDPTSPRVLAGAYVSQEMFHSRLRALRKELS